MEVVYERCGGLDVHKKEVVACAITPEGKEIPRFGTMTADLLALGEWLQAKGCTHVAMESTGVYWKPIYNLLEGQGLTLLVVNAQPIKAVPGRKTDGKDAEGSRTCCATGCCGAASSRTGPNGSCGSWSGTAKPSSGSGPAK